MTPIVSPTTTDRIVRTVGLTAMFAVFSGWFLYDGFVGYPNENLTKAVESLDPVPEELPPINPAITKAATADFTGDLKRQQLSWADITSQLGRPGWESVDQSEIRYFGPGGVLRISLSGDRAQDGRYVPGHNDDIELVWQKLLGAVMLPVALGMILQLIRVLTTKVVLTDQALILRARPPIPFDAMKAIDAGKLRKRGSLDLHYSYNEKQKKVRLDDYVIRDFRPIVAEICNRCNFENPLPPPKTQPDSA
ncbi:MAG: hypothetical protein V3W34_14295 [Phycisphaerae bacterium]